MNKFINRSNFKWPRRYPDIRMEVRKVTVVNQTFHPVNGGLFEITCTVSLSQFAIFKMYRLINSSLFIIDKSLISAYLMLSFWLRLIYIYVYIYIGTNKESDESRIKNVQRKAFKYNFRRTCRMPPNQKYFQDLIILSKNFDSFWDTLYLYTSYLYICINIYMRGVNLCVGHQKISVFGPIHYTVYIIHTHKLMNIEHWTFNIELSVFFILSRVGCC